MTDFETIASLVTSGGAIAFAGLTWLEARKQRRLLQTLTKTVPFVAQPRRRTTAKGSKGLCADPGRCGGTSEGLKTLVMTAETARSGSHLRSPRSAGGAPKGAQQLEVFKVAKCRMCRLSPHAGPPRPGPFPIPNSGR